MKNNVGPKQDLWAPSGSQARWDLCKWFITRCYFKIAFANSVATNSTSIIIIAKFLKILPLLKVTVKEFSPQSQKFPTFSTSSLNRCLTSTDLNHLWLAYLNVVHFNNLPRCFFPNISSAFNARNYFGIKVYPGLEVQLDFNSRNKLDESFYSNLHADLDVAIKDSSSTEDPLSALQLLRERLRLEISQQKWDNAANS
ncbi:uncharacterized protein LOC144424405 [Styela clava]